MGAVGSQCCIQSPLQYGALSPSSTSQSLCHQGLFSLSGEEAFFLQLGGRELAGGMGRADLTAFMLLLLFLASLLLSEESGSSSRGFPGIKADLACSLLPPLHGHLGFCFPNSAKALPLFQNPCVLLSLLWLSVFFCHFIWTLQEWGQPTRLTRAGKVQVWQSCMDLSACLPAGGPCFYSPAQLSHLSPGPCIQRCLGAVPVWVPHPLKLSTPLAEFIMAPSTPAHPAESHSNGRPYHSPVIQGPGPSACHRDSQLSRTVSSTS